MLQKAKIIKLKCWNLFLSSLRIWIFFTFVSVSVSEIIQNRNRTETETETPVSVVHYFRIFILFQITLWRIQFRDIMCSKRFPEFNLVKPDLKKKYYLLRSFWSILFFLNFIFIIQILEICLRNIKYFSMNSR